MSSLTSSRLSNQYSEFIQDAPLELTNSLGGTRQSNTSKRALPAPNVLQSALRAMGEHASERSESPSNRIMSYIQELTPSSLERIETIMRELGSTFQLYFMRAEYLVRSSGLYPLLNHDVVLNRCCNSCSHYPCLLSSTTAYSFIWLSMGFFILSEYYALGVTYLLSSPSVLAPFVLIPAFTAREVRPAKDLQLSYILNSALTRDMLANEPNRNVIDEFFANNTGSGWEKKILVRENVYQTLSSYALEAKKLELNLVDTMLPMERIKDILNHMPRVRHLYLRIGKHNEGSLTEEDIRWLVKTKKISKINFYRNDQEDHILLFRSRTQSYQMISRVHNISSLFRRAWHLLFKRRMQRKLRDHTVPQTPTAVDAEYSRNKRRMLFWRATKISKCEKSVADLVSSIENMKSRLEQYSNSELPAHLRYITTDLEQAESEKERLENSIRELRSGEDSKYIVQQDDDAHEIYVRYLVYFAE